MYRPVKPSELNRCLEVAAAHVKKSREARSQTQALTDSYRAHIQIYEEIFLRALLSGDMSIDKEITDGFEYFKLPFAAQTRDFTVILIRIDHYRTLVKEMGEQDKHLLIINILRCAEEVLLGLSAKAFVRAFQEVPVVIAGSLTTEEKFMLGDKLKQTVFERTNTRCTVGIGRTYGLPSDIPISAREADAAFGHRYRTGYNAVIPIDFVERGAFQAFRYPHARAARLVYSAIVGDYEYAKGVLTELFNALAAAGQLPPGKIINTVMGIVTGISSSAADRSLPYSSELASAFPSAEIFQLKTIEDGFTFLDRGLKSFCRFVGREY
jgi:hypothetical protein